MRSTHLSAAVTVIAVSVGVVLAAQSAQSQTYQEKVLCAFKGGSDGANPSAGVIEDAKGNLYRTTITGDLYGPGTVFKLSRMGKESAAQVQRRGRREDPRWTSDSGCRGESLRDHVLEFQRRNGVQAEADGQRDCAAPLYWRRRIQSERTDPG